MIVGFQEWRELLFVHFRVDQGRLRALVPRRLSIDEFDGSAWVSFTPFTLRRPRLRGLPPLPDFDELNFRTYVTLEGRGPGIWFFSLDASSTAAVIAARATIRLPYFRADIERGEGSYQCVRRGSSAARFVARWRVGPAVEKGAREDFLCERYRLYSRAAGPVLFTQKVAHDPWRLRAAAVDELTQTVSEAAGLGPLTGDPLCHFATPGPIVSFSPFLPC